mmetsp:Transcript_19223/g.34205  ORF Transcript_19223/g.34205 Transcript_19223/m.34205 type:complete len:88 (-) Transcript_19223:50-313(-)
MRHANADSEVSHRGASPNHLLESSRAEHKRLASERKHIAHQDDASVEDRGAASTQPRGEVAPSSWRTRDDVCAQALSIQQNVHKFGV